MAASMREEPLQKSRYVFVVSREVWDRFVSALDRPAVDVEGLAELMNTPTVLDEA